MSVDNFRVAILDDFEKLAATVPAYEELRTRASVTLLSERLDTSEQFTRALSDKDAILLMRERTTVTERELELMPKLKLISQVGRTSRHLDLAAASRRGITVTGTPSDRGTTTKELTVGLILALVRKIPQVDRRMRQERWPPVVGQMLEGKTIGVLGFGRIGQEVARILRAFNTRVLAYSRTLTPEKAATVGAECATLEALLRESDLVTIHVPLNANTRGLIGEKELATMKRGAMLVNTARGAIVSEPAMIRALESGHLGGVGLDVFEVEPLPMDHPLRRFDNAILLSHRGYATIEILQERYQQALENILAFLDGKPLPLLNPEVRNQSELGGHSATTMD
jgi:phosphoglycerate dehydrogenase-like enzyme